MIEDIHNRITALPEALRELCERIFYVNISIGRALPPPPMEAWVVRQFGDVDAVREQTVVSVTNRLTLESALFNPLRARRPSQAALDDTALEAWIARELAAHDIFSDPERDTTADVFGRIRGQFCVTASNVAKYEGWHGLVIFDDPHPLRFGAAQLADYLGTALRWIAAAHACDPQAIYPIITWNCLPRSGATIVHGHMQVALARGMTYARVELWRRAAETYRAATGRDYFGDLYTLHDALGLAIPSGGATRAFAHLTPLRNREIVVLADPRQKEDEGTSRQADRQTQLAPALYAVLRRLIDEQGVRAFNLAIALPPLATTAEDWHGVPIVARVGDRGNPLSDRSDVGAMELFASGCITADPFEVAAQLRSAERVSK